MKNNNSSELTGPALHKTLRRGKILGLLGFILISINAIAQNGWQVNSNPQSYFSISKDGTDFLKIDPYGQVRIESPGSNQVFKLSVDGMLRAREIYVNEDAWPDYVFHESYSLLPLRELENYIHRHKHLPKIPSASEVMENGLSVSFSHKILLEKIEELTLYIIAQQKDIDALKTTLQVTAE